MEIEEVSVIDIAPYENNPRKNDRAVDIVMKSIQEFGFLVPVILDDKNTIVAGHTRIKAAIKLGMEKVPVIYTEGLTEAQIKAFRIMDNKSQEYAEWDINLLKQEMESLKEIGFDLDTTGFDRQAREIIDLPENLEDVPDVELEGALKRFNKVIVIVGMQYDEHENVIREFLELPTNRKTMKSTEFIEILKKRGI